MSQAPSTFKIVGLLLLATLIGGLLFAQNPPADEVESASPSDVPIAADEEELAAPPEASSETDVAEDLAPTEPAQGVESHPVAAPAPADTDDRANWQRIIAAVTIFVLAVFVGFEVITKVPPTLHTPLMSGANAISGITLVGAVIVAATFSFSGFVGFIAVALATVNAVGGFMVTHRMLSMFKKR
ncbi:MAG: NAD(P) transhydrogenase subunit alpha [Pirellulaceae bacterium]